MDPYQEIAVIFVVLCALFIAGTWFFSWCIRHDEEWEKRNPVTPDPEVQRWIAEQHCEKVQRKRGMK